MLFLSLGDWFRGRVPRRRPASTSVIISIVGDEYWLVLFSLIALLLFFMSRNRTRGAGPIALHQRSRGPTVLVYAEEVTFGRRRETGER